MKLRYDCRKIEGEPVLRLWAPGEGYWYVAWVGPLEEEKIICATLGKGEMEVDKRLGLGSDYALPWLRGEIKNAKGSGYIIKDEDIGGT